MGWRLGSKVQDTALRYPRCRVYGCGTGTLCIETFSGETDYKTSHGILGRSSTDTAWIFWGWALQRLIGHFSAQRSGRTSSNGVIRGPWYDWANTTPFRRASMKAIRVRSFLVEETTIPRKMEKRLCSCLVQYKYGEARGECWWPIN